MDKYISLFLFRFNINKVFLNNFYCIYMYLYKMKIIIFIALLFCSCTSTKILLNASSQNWTGGLKGSGSGTNYKFILIAPESEKGFSIEDICIDGKLYKGAIYQKTFSKGDTILVSSRKTKESCQQENVISYLLNNEKHQIEIDTIEQLPKLFYP